MMNDCLPNDTENCKAIANKKKKKFIEMQKEKKGCWTRAGIPFSQLPDIIGRCDKMTGITRAVYWYMFTLNPCRPSVNEITKNIGCSKSVAVSSINELVCRDILILKEKGQGTRPNLFEFSLIPENWDLESSPERFAVKKKRQFDAEKFKEKYGPSGTDLIPQADLAVSTSYRKDFSGTDLIPLNPSSGTDLIPQADLAVSTSYRKGGSNIRLSDKINYQINLNEEKIKDGQGLMVGPARGQETQLPLTFKTLIHGDKKEDDVFRVKVSKNAMTAEKISDTFRNLIQSVEDKEMSEFKRLVEGNFEASQG